MDIATLLGLLIGLAAVLVAMVHEAGLGVLTSLYVQGPAALIVFGGCAAALLLTFRMPDFLQGLKAGLKVFRAEPQDPEAMIRQLVRCADTARKDGILALEPVAKQAADPFLAQGLRLAIDGTDPDVIEKILANKIEAMETRHNRGKLFYEVAGRYAPGFGMCGTLIGVIRVLQRVQEPRDIAIPLSFAMVATLYGALAANFLFLPMADKLINLHRDEALVKRMVIEGLVAIQAGDNPRIVEDKLRTFLRAGA